MHVDFKKIHNKIALLAIVTFMTLVGVVTICPKPMDNVSAANYDDSGYELALSTAFYDAYTDAEKAPSEILAPGEKTKKQQAVRENAAKFTTAHFGNVGLLMGKRTPSMNAGSFATMELPLSLTKEQVSKGYPIDKESAKKYIALGNAIHSISEKGKKSDPKSARLGESLDSLSDTGRSLTNMGTQLLKKYNPAPTLLVLFDNIHNSPVSYPENVLLQEVIMTNPDLKAFVLFFGGPSGILPSVPFSFVLVTVIVMLLLITSVLMTLINGRAAGENIRKAMVKIVVTSIGLPLIASGLTWGVDFLENVAGGETKISKAEMVEKHLLFADWYGMGFKIPDGETLAIVNGQMSISPTTVRKINEMVYLAATGKEPTDALITERIKTASKDAKNLTTVASITAMDTNTSLPYDTSGIFEAATNLSLNDPGKPVELAGIGHIENASMELTAKDSDGAYTVTNKNTKRWGIAPIAAYNLMNTDFSDNGLTVYTVGKSAQVPTVAFNAGLLASSGVISMSPLVRFIATYAILLAAIKGLFQIFTNGFGGIASGGVKSTLGNSAGLGQAAGGAIALLGGVFGIGIIMAISLNLLDAVYGVTTALFDGAAGNASVLDPIRELAPDIPLIGGFIEEMLVNLASFVISLIMMFTLPKFGGIPVTVFCQKLSDLPDIMAERAQQIENRFTGDFRAGSGVGGGGMTGALAGVGAEASARGGAMKMGAAAVAGFGLSKIGNHIADKHSDSASMADSESESDTDKKADPDTANTENNAGNDIETTNESVNDTENTSDNDAVSDNDTISEKDGSDSMSESANYSENDSLQDNDTIQDSVSERDSIAENVSDSDTMSEMDSSQDNMADVDHSSESMANTSNDSKSETSSTAQSSANNHSSHSESEAAKSGLNPRAQGAKGASSMADKAKTANTAPANKTTVSEPTKANRHDKIMRAVGKGIAAAGGNTTGRQAIAGAAHMAGGLVGAQKTTGRILANETGATQKQQQATTAQQDKAQRKEVTTKTQNNNNQEQHVREYENRQQVEQQRRQQMEQQRQRAARRNAYDPRDDR